jgi:hypothetical protein
MDHTAAEEQTYILIYAHHFAFACIYTREMCNWFEFYHFLSTNLPFLTKLFPLVNSHWAETDVMISTNTNLSISLSAGTKFLSYWKIYIIKSVNQFFYLKMCRVQVSLTREKVSYIADRCKEAKEKKIRHLTRPGR